MTQKMKVVESRNLINLGQTVHDRMNLSVDRLNILSTILLSFAVGKQ